MDPTTKLLIKAGLAGLIGGVLIIAALVVAINQTGYSVISSI